MAAIEFYTCSIVFVLLHRVSVLTLKERKGRSGIKSLKHVKTSSLRVLRCDEGGRLQ